MGKIDAASCGPADLNMRVVLQRLTLGLAVTIAGANVAFADDVVLKNLTRQGQQEYLQGNYAAAQEKYLQAFAQSRSAAPKLQIIILSNLGAAYREAHKYPDAEQQFEKALAIAEKHGLERDSVTVTLMEQYTNLLRRLKRNEEADAMQVRAEGPRRVATSVSAPGPRTAVGDKTNTPIEFDKKIAVNAKGVKTINVDDLTAEELRDFLRKDPGNTNGWMWLANKYRKEKKFDLAIDAFRTAWHSGHEKVHLALLGIAMCQYETGHYHDAVEEARKYQAHCPDDPSVYLLLRSCYSNLGEQRLMLENDQAFVDKFPDHEHATTISQMIPRLQQDIEKQAAKAVAVPESYVPSDWEQEHCWARAPMPLKIWFTVPDETFVFSSSYDSLMTEGSPGEIIVKAMNSWAQASHGRVQFTPATTREDANIIVTCTESGDGIELESAAGVTTWDTSSRTNRKAKITLLMTDKSTGKPLDRAEFYSTCLHEFGHALGLEHSSSVHDIMYRATQGTPLLTLSPNDALRINKLYSLK